MLKKDYKYTGIVGLQLIEPSNFDGMIKNYMDNEKSFRIVKKPYSSEMHFQNPLDVPKCVCPKKWGGYCAMSPANDSNFSNKQKAAVRDINKDFYEHLTILLRNNQLHEIKRIYNRPKAYIYKDNWGKLKIGDHFWYYDFENFYPSIAVRLGYVSKEIIDKYTPWDDIYKRCRNMAFSKIVSRVKVDYVIRGKFSHSIETDISTLEYAYQNIRVFGQNFIDHLCDKFRWFIIGRDIDNFLYPMDQSPKIIASYILAHGLDVKKFYSTKISEYQYRIEWDHKIKTISNVC
jgi:hypothetical protein